MRCARAQAHTRQTARSHRPGDGASAHQRRRAGRARPQLPRRRGRARRARLRRGQDRRLRRADEHDAVRRALRGDGQDVRDGELPLGRVRRVQGRRGRVVVPDGELVPVQLVPNVGRHQRGRDELVGEPADRRALPRRGRAALGARLLGVRRARPLLSERENAP